MGIEFIAHLGLGYVRSASLVQMRTTEAHPHRTGEPIGLGPSIVKARSVYIRGCQRGPSPSAGEA
jgi:hypothetical protein